MGSTTKGPQATIRMRPQGSFGGQRASILPGYPYFISNFLPSDSIIIKLKFSVEFINMAKHMLNAIMLIIYGSYDIT